MFTFESLSGLSGGQAVGVCYTLYPIQFKWLTDTFLLTEEPGGIHLGSFFQFPLS